MPSPEEPLFIVNPIAGSGRAHGFVGQIEAWLKEQGIEGRLLETREPGHAERLAAAAADLGHDRVVAVGGDGTIQEVINGLLAAGAGDGKVPALGVIPAGRGNDMARSVGLPIDPLACLAIAVGPALRPFDVGQARSSDGSRRHFGAAGGVGFDAAVAYTMAVHRRFWMRGEAGYFLGTLNELRRYRNSELEVTLSDGGVADRVVRQRFLFVAFANGPFYGGGMQICPDARTDDGLLDVCLVGDLSRLAALRELPGIYQAKHLRNPKVEIVRARSVRLDGPPTARVHLDGEPFGTVPVDVTLLPGALHVAAGDAAMA